VAALVYISSVTR